MRRRLSYPSRAARVVAVAAAVALALFLLPRYSTHAGSVQVLAPVTGADGRFGLCDVLPGNPAGVTEPWAQLAYDAGARINRWEFRWDRIEPSAGAWSFNADDAAVSASQVAGLDVLGILIGTPGWAEAKGQKPGNGVPQGLNLSSNDPGNLWAQYVRQTVSHYKGLVKYWEIWNELDLSYFWSGKPADYFRLLQTAFVVIRSVDPSAQVLMAGMVAPDLGFVKAVLQADGSDPNHVQNHGYFDAAAWHAYGAARDTYTNLLAFRSLLATNGYGDSPLWVTEAGFPASNPNGEPRQAAFVLQSIVYALAAGADRVLIYRESDSAEPKTWGLLTSTGAPRMGYVAFQTAAQYFAHTKAVSYDPGPNVERFSLYEPNQRVTVLWNHGTAGRQVHLSAADQLGAQVDWTGTSSQLTASNSQFGVTVPGAAYNLGVDDPGAVVGGPPVMLVESNVSSVPLPNRQYLLPLTGKQRRALVFNAGNSDTYVRVAAASNPQEHVIFHLAPHSLQTVDLDLLAGIAYTGMVTVASENPVDVAGIDSTASHDALQPSASWYVPGANGTLSLTNTSSKPAQASIVLYGARGRVRARTNIALPPWPASVQWTVPQVAHAANVSLRVTTTAPLLVGGGGSLPAGAPQTSWFALHTPSGKIAVFNPGGSPAHLDIRVAGKPETPGMTVQPYHTVMVPDSGAAISVNADVPIVLGDDAAPVTEVSTLSTVSADGPLKAALLFNPSPQPAHVSVVTVTGLLGRQSTVTVPPLKAVRLALRTAQGPARGIIARSDVPLAVAAVR